MSAPYYTGDAVPLKFEISDQDGGVTPSAVKVTIVNSHNDLNGPVDATIDDNTISYTVPGSVNEHHGDYIAYFVCTLGYGERTHKMAYKILPNPEEV